MFNWFKSGKTRASAAKKLVVGLGNPGLKFDLTRHNAGFMAIEAIAGRDGWQDKGKFKGLIKEVDGVIYLKPLTYMNLSGLSVSAVKNFYKINNQDITVIHDDIDLPLGTIKLKAGGGSAGHNGLKSIIGAIGDDFNRVRIGVRSEPIDKIGAREFVLARFTKDELELLSVGVKEVVAKLN